MFFSRKPEGKTDEQIANEGLDAMEAWMRKLGVAMTIGEVGVTEDMIDELADRTPLLPVGYHHLTRDEVAEIYRKSL